MTETVSIPGGGNAAVTIYGNGTVFAGNGNDTINIDGAGKVHIGNGADSISVYGPATVKTGYASNGDTITLHGFSDVTVGGGTATISLLEGGKITEYGIHGNDSINLGTGSDTIYEWGNATVYGADSGGKFGGATINGGGDLKVHDSGSITKDFALSGNITLLGGAANTEFVGGTGNSVFLGGTGSDTFIGGSGHDTLTGGTGANKFEFLGSEAGGQHVITNFVSGDQLYVEGYTLSYLESQHDVTTAGGNTYISIDGGATSIELKGFTGLNSSDITTHK